MVHNSGAAQELSSASNSFITPAEKIEMKFKLSVLSTLLGLSVLGGCAPRSFVRTDPGWKTIALREPLDVDYDKAWQTIVRTVIRRWDIEIMNKETITKTVPITINIMPLYLLGKALYIRITPGSIRSKGLSKKSIIWRKNSVILKLAINKKKPNINNMIPKFNFDFPSSIAIVIHLLFENDYFISLKYSLQLLFPTCFYLPFPEN